MYTYIHNAILLSYEKEWNFATCNNMDELGEYYAKWNKSDIERQMYNMTYMECKICNKLGCITKKKQTHRYKVQISGYQ